MVSAPRRLHSTAQLQDPEVLNEDVWKDFKLGSALAAGGGQRLGILHTVETTS